MIWNVDIVFIAVSEFEQSAGIIEQNVRVDEIVLFNGHEENPFFRGRFATPAVLKERQNASIGVLYPHFVVLVNAMVLNM